MAGVALLASRQWTAPRKQNLSHRPAGKCALEVPPADLFAGID
jgi:hypothetical protein